MKNIYAIMLSILFSTVCWSLSAQIDNLQLISSNLEWVGYGEVGDFSQRGNIQIKEANIRYHDTTEMSGVIVIDMKSISHEDAKLEKHLKAKDFFNVKKYPEARFQIEQMGNGVLMGSLSMNGHQSPISFAVSITESGDELRVSGKAEIDRTLFDIKYNSSSYFQDLGSYAIKNNFDLNFDLLFYQSRSR